MDTAQRRRRATVVAALLGVGLPVMATVLLLPAGGSSRDYVFIYIALVAILAIGGGLGPAMTAALASFLLVDYFFVPPLHTLRIDDTTDIVNLLVFVATAGLVGGLVSRRRRAQLRAEALSSALQAANLRLEQLNREQADAAAMAVRLARTEQEVHALEESERFRTDLLANVSHELRTPLASILTGSTDLLSRPDLDPQVRAEVESVVSETQRLARLVSDMLDLARIEGHALRIEPAEVAVGDAVDAAVTRLRHAAPRRPVTVEVTAGLEVIADWGRLGQVLDNLLANADSYSPPGAPIHVEAVPGKRQMVVIRVIDHGRGIPPEQRERVFERFVRADEADDVNGGTGLGLAIVRGIVEAHAGRAWIEDPRDGEGSRLAIALPAADATG